MTLTIWRKKTEQKIIIFIPEEERFSEQNKKTGGVEREQEFGDYINTQEEQFRERKGRIDMALWRNTFGLGEI